MAGFFKGLGKKASEAGQGAVQQAKIFAEVTKIKSHISDEEDKIDELYKQIGKDYFERHKDDPNDVYAQACDSIKEANANIVAFNQQIRDIKGVSICPACGAEVDRNSGFCSSCGAALVVAPVEEAAAPVVETVPEMPVQPEAPMGGISLDKTE